MPALPRHPESRAPRDLFGKVDQAILRAPIDGDRPIVRQLRHDQCHDEKTIGDGSWRGRYMSPGPALARIMDGEFPATRHPVIGHHLIPDSPDVPRHCWRCIALITVARPAASPAYGIVKLACYSGREAERGRVAAVRVRAQATVSVPVTSCQAWKHSARVAR